MSTPILVAPGPCAQLEQSIEHVPSFDAPAREGKSAGESAPTHDRFLGEIADALHANLPRGYLEGEERIREVAEALHDVISLADATGTQLFFVNAAYEQIFGRSREELYANPLAFLDAVHPEDRERVRNVIMGQASRNYDIEFRLLRPSGEQRWAWMRGFPVRNDDGEIYRIAAITEDITERKQVIESHERLIRGFTHDVKNPLGAADGYLSLLAEGVFGEMSEKQTQSVAHARRSIRTALNLIAGLLDIERAEAGQLDITQERVDLGTATREIVDEFRAAAEAKALTLSSQVCGSEDALVVESDSGRVRQILANLLSNAVKYTQPKGSILVDARVVSTDGAPWRGHWAALAVVDNGPGIPIEKQGLVFREFTRFDPGAAAGSGIGLAISRRLARALGGEITFTSMPGVGSTFTLWLPIEPPPPVTERRRVARKEA